MNQTVYYNGKIITMNGEQIVEAILVEDGRIREVGSNNEILNRKSPEAEVINLEAILNLPKGTEHFLTDIHGEYEAFAHVLKNGSGAVQSSFPG